MKLKDVLADAIVFVALLVGIFAIVSLMKKVNAAEIQYADIEYQYFHKSARFAEMPNHQAKEGLAINFETKLVGPLYWKNRIHALTDPGQYRLVGWQFELGVKPLFFLDHKASKAIELYYKHHSQHLLESTNPNMKFPVNDSLGLRWVIYERP